MKKSFTLQLFEDKSRQAKQKKNIWTIQALIKKAQISF